MSERPWWHPTDHNWNELLPTVVILSPDYMADLPLWRGDGGRLAWQITKFSPELLDRLASWQKEFDSNFHWDNGWRSTTARDRWAAGAQDLAAEVRTQLGSRAELIVDLWPLRDAPGRMTPEEYRQ
jgi:hypothetical protein